MSVKKLEPRRCLRCGACCDKGSPALQAEDRHLIDDKIISSKYLYTIRKGEPDLNDTTGAAISAKSDIIKFKGTQERCRCIFLNSESKLCDIYENRPFECRAFECMDTEVTEDSYSENYLTRKELFAASGKIYELIDYHQEQCSYEKIRALIKDGNEESLKKVLEIIELDSAIRCSVIEKMTEGVDLSELLFGRPLKQTIRGFGLELLDDGDGYRLSRKTAN